MQSFGHKTGSGAPASAQDIALDRKERLRRLAIETVDLSKDPYLHRNHVGKIECRLCLTLHLNEASYLTHTQGRKHQTNLARRAAKEQSLGSTIPPNTIPPDQAAGVSGATQGGLSQGGVQASADAGAPPPSFGRPGYRVTKLRDPQTKQLGLRIEIEYSAVGGGGAIEPAAAGGASSAECRPQYKFLKSWEQKVEAVDPSYQYIVFAAKSYDTIGFKIQSFDIDSKNLLSFWDESNKIFLLQFLFKKPEDDDQQQQQE